MTELHLPAVGANANDVSTFARISPVRVRAEVTADATDLGATASFGFVGVSATDGMANCGASVEAVLNDPMPDSSHPSFTIQRLTDAIIDIDEWVTVTTEGTANIMLPNITVDAGFPIPLGASPKITIDIADVFDPTTTATPTFTDLGDLLDFENLTSAALVQVLRDIAAYVRDLEQHSFLGDPLPGINKSVGELIALADKFDALADLFGDDPGQTLQDMESVLEAALASLGGSPPDPAGIDFNVEFLEVNLQLAESFDDSLPLNLDIASLNSQAGSVPGLAGIGSLFDLQASSTLTVDADASATLRFGVDLTDPLSPRPYLHESTGFTLGASVGSNDINFSASISGVGVSIDNGTVEVGNGSGGQAMFAVMMTDVLDDRHYLDTIGLDSIDVTLTGEAHIDLPITLLTDDSPIGSLTIDIDQLDDIANSITITPPDISLSDLLANLDFSDEMEAFREGIRLLFDFLGEVLDGEVFGIPLPVVGEGLADAIMFIEEIADKLDSDLAGTDSTAAVRTAIFTALGDDPGGLNLIEDIAGVDPDNPDDTIDINDVVLEEIDDGTGKIEDVRYRLKLDQSLVDASVPIGFDIGLPGLRLSVDQNAAINLSIGFTFDLILGISREDGLYIDTSVLNELQVGFSVDLENFEANGELAFLEIKVTDGAAPNTTNLSGGFTVDLKDPIGGNGRLTFDEIASGAVGLDDVVDFDVDVNANVNLALALGFDLDGTSGVLRNLPRLEADFKLVWFFDTASGTTGLDGSIPSVEFNNIRVNLSEFFNQFVSPIVDTIKDITDPLAGVIEFLQEPLPLVDLTLLELLAAFAPDAALTAQAFIDDVGGVINLVNQFDTDIAGDTVVELGSFSLQGLDVREMSDLSDYEIPETNTEPPDPGTSFGDPGMGEDFAEAAEALNGAIAFPIVDSPKDAFGLLLGKDVDLFTYDMPPVNVGDDFKIPLGVFPVGPIPVALNLIGAINVGFDLKFGFDTFGIRQAVPLLSTDPAAAAAKVFEGFFIADVVEDEDGNVQDVDEAWVTGRLGVSAPVEAGIARAGAEGGITAGIYADLKDDGDGKVRPLELINNLPCFFDLEGRVGMFIDAFVEIGICPICVGFSVPILPETTIFTFDIPCGVTPPILAENIDGVLHLNMGPRAPNRLHVNVIDGDEAFLVTPVDNATVLVEAFEFVQVYGAGKLDDEGEPGVPITLIVADGGLGNDIITMDGGLSIETDLRGGSGDDAIVGGGAPNKVQGDGGSDDLQGGPVVDTIYGHNDGLGAAPPEDDAADLINGAGDDDMLFGNGGDDEIFGGLGSDTIHGGDGADTIRGNEENDTIHGDAGDDDIDGGADDDLIYGSLDVDMLAGGGGSDTIIGGGGLDRAFGNAGDDTIRGQEGQDVVDGSEDNDDVYGDAGDDLVFGGAGDDTLNGVIGFDQIFAGTGDDTAYGGFGNDAIFGEDGNDDLFGNEGDDHLDGGAGIDMLFGLGGDDRLIANAGLGTALFGGAGNDELFGTDEGGDDPDLLDEIFFGDHLDGGPGDDHIWGLAGADIIHGREGDDWIDGGFHGDHVLAGADDDVVFGAEGDDRLEGNDGLDQLFGEVGQDLLLGQGDDDALDGGAGADVLRGGDDDDTLFGGGGVGDQLFGEAGHDVLHGSDDGADMLDGGPGNDHLFGNGGNDILFGGDDDDVLDGGPGDDELSGGPGEDVLVGGADHDVLFGHNNGGVDDDSAPDILYGDFGTNTDDAGADQLFGNGGNDRLFGEGDDDAIDDFVNMNAVDDHVDFGGGEGDPVETFATPTLTPDPTVQPAAPPVRAGEDLPQGRDGAGWWRELSASASGLGVSGDVNLSVEAVVAGAVATVGLMYVAWADTRRGNHEICLARRNDGAWDGLGGSARLGGVSDTVAESRRPSVAVTATDDPIIAWTEITGEDSDIFVATFNSVSSAWEPLASSLSPGGISGTGTADHAQLLVVDGDPIVAYLDGALGSEQVVVQQLSSGAWSPVASPISSTGASDVAFAADGTKLAVAWSQEDGTGAQQVYVSEFNGVSWNELAGSATSGGVSDTALASTQPMLEYHGGDLFVAWEQALDGGVQVYTERFSGGVWQEAGDGAASGSGLSNSQGRARRPHLSTDSTTLQLAWVDDATRGRPGHHSAIYHTTWTGSAFDGPIPSDNTGLGIAPTSRTVRA